MTTMPFETFKQIANDAAERHSIFSPCREALTMFAVENDPLTAFCAMKAAAELFRFPETEADGRCIAMAVLGLRDARSTGDYSAMARCLEPILLP